MSDLSDDDINDMLNEPLDEEGKQDLLRYAAAAHALKGKTIEEVEYRRGELVLWLASGERVELASPFVLLVETCKGHDVECTHGPAA